MPGELTAKPRELVKLYFAFRCTFPNCSKGFPDAVELRHHKINDPDHYFCPDDDYEAKDYADMKRHHATSDIHNACPSSRCGINTMTTVEALRLHLMSQHRSAASTHCSGCDIHYKTPEALWGHLDMKVAPVVCRGPMVVNNAMARYREDYKKYVWRDWMKSTGWHHHDQKRWYSDPPGWFLERLDANNNYVAPVFAEPGMPENDWVNQPSDGWPDEHTTSGSCVSSHWACETRSDWISPPSQESNNWPALDPAVKSKSQINGSAQEAAFVNSDVRKKALITPVLPYFPNTIRSLGSRAQRGSKPAPSWSRVAAMR